MSAGDVFDRVNTGLGQVILAFLGGLISALMRREASTWQTALLGACGAAFAGFVVAHMCRATGLSDDWSYVFVGVSGWLGAARTIGYVERLLVRHTGLEMPDDSLAEPGADAHAANASAGDAANVEEAKHES